MVRQNSWTTLLQIMNKSWTPGCLVGEHIVNRIKNNTIHDHISLLKNPLHNTHFRMI